MQPSIASSVDNANAGVFFSTAALLIGVLVTVVGAALTQVLLEGADISHSDLRPRRRHNLTVLIVVIVVDLWGVGFPLFALYRSALGNVTSGLVTWVFVSTVAVGVGNIIFPVYIIRALFGIQYWYHVIKIGLARGDERTQALRDMLIEGGYIEAERFDFLMLRARSGAIDYESAVELLSALNKCLVFGKAGKFSFTRAMPYWCLHLLIPYYARRLSQRSEHPPGQANESANNEL
jgi:hypothetical protein